MYSKGYNSKRRQHVNDSGRPVKKPRWMPDQQSRPNQPYYNRPLHSKSRGYQLAPDISYHQRSFHVQPPTFANPRRHMGYGGKPFPKQNGYHQQYPQTTTGFYQPHSNFSRPPPQPPSDFSTPPPSLPPSYFSSPPPPLPPSDFSSPPPPLPSHQYPVLPFPLSSLTPPQEDEDTTPPDFDDSSLVLWLPPNWTVSEYPGYFTTPVSPTADAVASRKRSPQD